MRYEIKQLGVGGVLDQAIVLVKENFGLLVGTVLILYFPFSLVSGLVIADKMPNPALLESPETAQLFWQQYAEMMIWISGLALANLLIVLPASTAAVIHAVSSLYLKSRSRSGRPTAEPCERGFR